MAYKLELPSGSRIHPVVHVSQLKKYIPAQQEVSTDLSSVTNVDDAILEPVSILGSCLSRRAGASAPRIKVKWGTHHSALINEEDESDLRCRFPHAQLGVKLALKGWGMS